MRRLFSDVNKEIKRPLKEAIENSAKMLIVFDTRYPFSTYGYHEEFKYEWNILNTLFYEERKALGIDDFVTETLKRKAEIIIERGI